MTRYNIRYQIMQFHDHEVIADNEEQAKTEFYKWMQSTFVEDEDWGYAIVEIEED